MFRGLETAAARAIPPWRASACFLRGCSGLAARLGLPTLTATPMATHYDMLVR